VRVATVIVQAWERLVRYRDGRLEAVLEPGRHRYSLLRYRRGRRWETRVDMRPRLWAVPGQELLTADSLPVRVSVHVEVSVVDPVRFVEAAGEPQAVLYAAVQLALRAAVAARSLEQLLAERQELNAELAAAVAPVAERLGVAAGQVVVRDVMLPAELRRAAAEVVLARQRGLAELERARAEAAALRSLANTARLLADHPELLQLRTVQAAERSGSTVVLTPR
jgi:regulator of protease activity HflC (stomatin/prohibitin superfamily)